uniref:Movement protein n=1 Tax=Syphacia muris TaxID=451379 RepID=A0A0N5A9X4_9BILA
MSAGIERIYHLKQEEKATLENNVVSGMHYATPAHTWDGYIFPGFRIWQLCAILLGITIIIIVIVCCFSKVRIPRTKRQIELSAAKRRMRKKHQQDNYDTHAHAQDERAQTIVLNTVAHSASRVSQSPDRHQSAPVLQNSRQTAV